jgi:hypothetical protein
VSLVETREITAERAIERIRDHLGALESETGEVLGSSGEKEGSRLPNPESGEQAPTSGGPRPPALCTTGPDATQGAHADVQGSAPASGPDAMPERDR